MCVCVAGSQKCCKDLANTWLDLRNAANSLQIEGKGVLPGDPSHWGKGREHGTRGHIYNDADIEWYRYIAKNEICRYRCRKHVDTNIHIHRYRHRYT